MFSDFMWQSFFDAFSYAVVLSGTVFDAGFWIPRLYSSSSPALSFL